MLELAERLRTVKTQVGIRFLALSAQELGGKGIENYLSRMTPEEKKNTLLVIGIDSLISGDKLLATSNAQALAERSRDRLLQLAKRDGIHIARGNSAMLDQSPPRTRGWRCFLRPDFRCCCSLPQIARIRRARHATAAACLHRAPAGISPSTTI